MKKILALALTAALLLGTQISVGSAQLTPPRNLSLTKESRIWFDGTSTVRSFSCTATKVIADVSGEPEAQPADVVKAATLTIPVAGLDCRNQTMNGHMQKALKASDNPQIKWRMTSYKVEGATVTIDGALTIAGKENAIQLRGNGSSDNGVLRVKGTKQIKMTEYGVKPPSLMLGAMKVGDQVTVSYDIALTQ